MVKSSSAPDLTSGEVKSRNIFKLFVCFNSNISKTHWEPDTDHPICYGCQRKFKFFFRRHHCRRCGKVFCHVCSGLKMRLDENAEIGQDGYYHRVCFFCFRSKDACTFNEQCFGQTSSLSNSYRMMREKKSLRTSISLMMDSNEFNAEVVEFCRPVLEIFKTKKSNNVLKKPVQAIRKAGLERTCAKCNENILVPTNRKLCMLCTKVYCPNCSRKTMVIFSNEPPNGLLDIVVTTDFEELVKKYDKCKRYRTCVGCEEKLKTLLDRRHFDTKLDTIHTEMCQIQIDIAVALKQQDKGVTSRSLHSEATEQRDSGIEMNNFPGDVVPDKEYSNETFDLRTEREIMKDGSRISTNLINNFFDKYKELTKLNSGSEQLTSTRIRLMTNVKQAMNAYYFQTKPKILKPTAHDVVTKTSQL